MPRPDEGEQGTGGGEGGEGDEVLLEYDVEWLSIVQASHHLLSNTKEQVICGKGAERTGRRLLLLAVLLLAVVGDCMRQYLRLSTGK